MAAVFHTQYIQSYGRLQIWQARPQDSPYMTPRKIFEKGRGQGHVNPAAANSLGGYQYAFSERLLAKYLYFTR